MLAGFDLAAKDFTRADKPTLLSVDSQPELA